MCKKTCFIFSIFVGFFVVFFGANLHAFPLLNSGLRVGRSWVIITGQSITTGSNRQSQMDGLGSGKSLAGGFIYFIFSPLFGEDEPNLTNIFEIG